MVKGVPLRKSQHP